MDVQTGAITEALHAVASGDPSATARLLPLVYDTLHEMASRKMQGEPLGATLQPTALVHEAYLRLFSDDEPSWCDRGHFYSTASRSMRRILVDHARRRAADKRGGGWQQVALTVPIHQRRSPPNSS